MVNRIYSTDWHNHVIPVPWSGCWLWEGPVRKRYGYHTLNNSDRLVHRLAWEESYGPIPVGLVVCHHCDVPLCCNPEHLFVGTQRQNIHDMMEKGRARWGVFPQADGIERCINGHEYTPENTSFQAGGKRRRCRICYRARNRIFRLSHNDRHNELARKYRQQKRDRLVCQE